jgi:hypothetical protein
MTASSSARGANSTAARAGGQAWAGLWRRARGTSVFLKKKEQTNPQTGRAGNRRLELLSALLSHTHRFTLGKAKGA